MGVLDVVLVVVFAALGRSSHAEMVDAAGLLRTAGPFLVGLGSGWLALVLMRRQGDSVLDGVVLWLAALVLAAANFMAVLDMTVANVSVPSIAGNLGATTSQGTWVITSYAVAEAITVPLTGWLAARFGAVRVFATAMGLFGLASLLCGLANSLGMLVFARILQGLAGGPLMPLSQTIVGDIIPPRQRGKYQGWMGVVFGVTSVAGPLAGGVITDSLGWRWLFFVAVPVGLVALFVIARFLDLPHEPRKAVIDTWGIVTMSLGVTAVLLAVSPDQKAIEVVYGAALDRREITFGYGGRDRRRSKRRACRRTGRRWDRCDSQSHRWAPAGWP